VRRLDGKVAIITGSTGGQEYAALCPEANRRAVPPASARTDASHVVPRTAAL